MILLLLLDLDMGKGCNAMALAQRVVGSRHHGTMEVVSELTSAFACHKNRCVQTNGSHLVLCENRRTFLLEEWDRRTMSNVARIEMARNLFLRDVEMWSRKLANPSHSSIGESILDICFEACLRVTFGNKANVWFFCLTCSDRTLILLSNSSNASILHEHNCIEYIIDECFSGVYIFSSDISHSAKC